MVKVFGSTKAIQALTGGSGLVGFTVGGVKTVDLYNNTLPEVEILGISREDLKTEQLNENYEVTKPKVELKEEHQEEEKITRGDTFVEYGKEKSEEVGEETKSVPKEEERCGEEDLERSLVLFKAYMLKSRYPVVYMDLFQNRHIKGSKWFKSELIVNDDFSNYKNSTYYLAELMEDISLLFAREHLSNNFRSYLMTQRGHAQLGFSNDIESHVKGWKRKHLTEVESMFVRHSLENSRHSELLNLLRAEIFV